MFDKIISWHIRQINDRKKRQIIKGCLSRWVPDLECLQEMKMESVDEKILRVPTLEA